MASIKILDAEPGDIPVIRELFHEYSSWLGFNLCFQNFDQEVSSLPGDYSPPTGRLIVARVDNEVAGCVALRELETDICEMKRLYVRPAFRNLGLGRQLTDRIIEEAQSIGYKRMRLDTLPGKMDRAIGMYRSLGFQEIPRYYNNPYDEAIFMELLLQNR